MISVLRFAPILILCAACKKEEPPPPPASEPTPPASAPEARNTVTAPPEPAVDVESLPVEEDFEAEAEKEVTAANLTKQLDELEKEIGTD